MAEKTIVDELDDYTTRAVSLVNDFVDQGVFHAKVFAPKGATKSLSGDIVGENAVVEGRVVIGIIKSSTENKGFDYAEFQHDTELFHAVEEGQEHTQGFADFGRSGNTFKKYDQGYHDQVGGFLAVGGVPIGKTRYASKFVDKGLEVIEPDFDRAIEREL